MDLETLSLTELIRLQNQISQTLVRRFERPLAIAFSDVVGYTPYTAKFGDAAGRMLAQRHLDLLGQALPLGEGRIIDTAGDGAFVCFPTVEQAARALVEHETLIANDNGGRTREHQLEVRVGLHHGSALTDGVVVSGEAVNLAARITATGEAGEIRLTRAAFLELPSPARVRCRALPPVEVRGVPKPVELYLYEWRDPSLFPRAVRVEETGQLLLLPAKETITFGRLRDAANDVVLTLPDEKKVLQISRWHFELRRHAGGFHLRPVSDQRTEVDGRMLRRGEDVPIRPGTVVRLSGVMTLTFLEQEAAPGTGTPTLYTI